MHRSEHVCLKEEKEKERTVTLTQKKGKWWGKRHSQMESYVATLSEKVKKLMYCATQQHGHYTKQNIRQTHQPRNTKAGKIALLCLPKCPLDVMIEASTSEDILVPWKCKRLKNKRLSWFLRWPSVKKEGESLMLSH